MCWRSNKLPETIIANENIKTIKILSSEKDIIYSYYFIFKYKLGELYEVDKLEYHRRDWFVGVVGYEIDEGFHSYVLDTKIITEDFNYYKIVSSNNDNLDHFYFRNEYIGICIIPKGSEYYINDVGEIVSKRIIIEKLIPIKDYVLGQRRLLSSIESKRNYLLSKQIWRDCFRSNQTY